MPRLFFALTPPESVADSLLDLCEGVPRARWSIENGFHLTLSFLGDVPPYQVSEAIAVADSMRSPILSLKLQGVGVFPHRGEPRVLWAGLEKNEELRALQKNLQNELRHAGFELERRKFHPHVTVGRVSRCPQGAISDWLARHMSYESDDFRLARFSLFSSQLGSTGSRYTVEEDFPFIPKSVRPG